ncbi:MAG: ATPase, partial [Acidimicrobiia bacterium]|nr:ATPase [Acidimicrobiia bacterium]
RAVLQGRDFVTPDDVKEVAVPALSHRLILKPEMWVQDITDADIVRECLESVPVPPTVPTNQ